MPIQWITEGELYGNSFVYENILIDAGVTPISVKPYRDAIDTVVLTHCHFDHAAHVKEIAHMCKAKVAIHKNDAIGLLDETRNLAMHFGARSPGIVPDIHLKDGDMIGNLRVIHTPGHTPGSICLHDKPNHLLISGDTVFTDGAFGRYDFFGGSRSDLSISLERLAMLEIEGLFPGHGMPVDTGGGLQIAAALGLIKSGYG